MCVAVPGKVLDIVDPEARLGRVDVFGTPRMVNLSLIGEVAPGDWVLVHTGFALERMSGADAEATVRLFEELGTALEEAAAESPDEVGA